MDVANAAHAASSVHPTDWQFLFNIAVGLIGLLLGFLMNRIFVGLDSLKKQDELLTTEINEIKIALPSAYVTQAHFDSVALSIFKKLDSINDRLYDHHKVIKEGVIPNQ